MKTTTKLTLATAILSVATLTSKAGPPVIVVAPPPPPVVVAPPPPVVVPAPGITVTIGVPDTYVWDGYEYVGVVNGQYYYLGPGNAWMVMPPDRLVRFHDWERGHSDWRDHAIHNELYRRDAQGHDHPAPQRHDVDKGYNRDGHDRHDDGR